MDIALPCAHDPTTVEQHGRVGLIDKLGSRAICRNVFTTHQRQNSFFDKYRHHQNSMTNDQLC